MGPCVVQVTLVESALSSSVNSTMLWVSNGLTKSSLIATFEGATDSAISMRPWPTSLLPSHAYTAPLPLVTALNVLFIAVSFFSQADQDSQRRKSLSTAKILSGVALIVSARWIRNVSGCGGASLTVPRVMGPGGCESRDFRGEGHSYAQTDDDHGKACPWPGRPAPSVLGEQGSQGEINPQGRVQEEGLRGKRNQSVDPSLGNARRRGR